MAKKKRELGRGPLVGSQQHGANDRRSGPRDARNEGRHLAQADLEGKGRWELENVLVAGLQGDLVHIKQHDPPKNQRDADENRRLKQDRLYEAMKCHTCYRRRQECEHYPQDEPASLRTSWQIPNKLEKARKIYRQHGEDRTELDEHLECLPG